LNSIAMSVRVNKKQKKEKKKKIEQQNGKNVDFSQK